MDFVARILEQMNRFIANPIASADLQVVPKKDEKYVLVNNSFMFRDGVKTIKNKKYLAFDLAVNPIIKESCFVIEGFELKGDFKIISKNDPKIAKKTNIEEAVQEEKQTIGEMIFVLMGEIDENIELVEEIEHDLFKALEYKPANHDQITIMGSKISCKSLEDEEETWSAIESKLRELTIPDDSINALKDTIGTPLSKLKSQIYLNLKIPASYEDHKQYFLDIISESIKQQISLYSTALGKIGTATVDGQQVMNEILRVSYNFVDDSDTLLRLITSICDLKPLLLWLTFHEHYLLTDTIKNLPWKKQNTKASLKVYAETIKKARNKAFHSLIPFSKAFVVKLPDNAIQEANLRIFSEFGSKSNSNRLDYKDKELVDVLMEFTRTSEEMVSQTFWTKNLNVLTNSTNLLDETALCIRALR